jgi:hypothetical protein
MASNRHRAGDRGRTDDNHVGNVAVSVPHMTATLLTLRSSPTHSLRVLGQVGAAASCPRPVVADHRRLSPAALIGGCPVAQSGLDAANAVTVSERMGRDAARQSCPCGPSLEQEAECILAACAEPRLAPRREDVFAGADLEHCPQQSQQGPIQGDEPVLAGVVPGLVIFQPSHATDPINLGPFQLAHFPGPRARVPEEVEGTAKGLHVVRPARGPQFHRGSHGAKLAVKERGFGPSDAGDGWLAERAAFDQLLIGGPLETLHDGCGGILAGTFRPAARLPGQPSREKELPRLVDRLAARFNGEVAEQAGAVVQGSRRVFARSNAGAEMLKEKVDHVLNGRGFRRIVETQGVHVPAIQANHGQEGRNKLTVAAGCEPHGVRMKAPSASFKATRSGGGIASEKLRS